MKRIFYSLNLLVIVLALCSQSLFAQTYNIFTAETPDTENEPNGVPIELGVKFRVTQGGTVDAIRFYKGTSNTGTHLGHLWTQGGTLLATVTFGSETASGWQSEPLSTPVTLIPGTIYVVSYYSPTGFYSFSANVFDNVGNTDYGAAPIFALDPDNDGDPVLGNGVFHNNAPTGGTDYFPNAWYEFGGGSNYFVDVAFTTFFPLPVTLVDFKATPNGKNVGLNWSTASEENNKGFEIQRSNNNTDWYTVGFVSGAGNSSSTRTYSYTDKELASGKYYYRLRQIDLDARIKLSSTALANISGIGQISLFQNFPNPVVRGGITTIRFDLPEDQRTRISLLDITGREVKLLADKTAQQGSHIITFDVSGLSKQMYIIRMQTAGEVITRKMMIQ